MSASSSCQVATAPPPVAAAIVSPRFCALHPTDLTFFEKPSWLKPAVLAATDTEGNVVFKVESHSWGPGNKHVVLDESEKPVLSVKKKKLSGLHERWKVLSMGDGSSDDNTAKADEPLFVVQRLTSALSQKKAMELDVFLAANTKRAVADFKIKGSYGQRNSNVYRIHESPMAVAQMSKEFKYVKRSPPEEAFGVSVSPEMDSAFVTALVVIMHEVQRHERHVRSVLEGVKSTAEAFLLAFNVGQDVEGLVEEAEEVEGRSKKEPAGDDVEGSEAGEDV